MTNVYRQHRSSPTGSRFWRVASMVFLVVGGVAVVLWAISWFRSQEAVHQAAAESAAGAAMVDEVPATTRVEATAVLYDDAGASGGIITRSGTVEAPSYDVVVRLPAIDTSMSAYAVWLLKDGLADVKHVGDLLPRADGSWALAFSSPDPLEYPNVAITLEPSDANPLPSGNDVAHAAF